GGRCITAGWAQSEVLSAQSQQAKQLMASGRYSEAIPIYQQVVKAVPNNVGLILNLGIAQHMAGGHYCEAIAHFQTSLEPHPKTWYALGHSYEALSQQTFEKLQKLAPESPYVMELLAEVRQRQGRKGAVEALKSQALSAKPLPTRADEALYKQTKNYNQLALE